MTWAVGACNVLGACAVMISDVQVTFGNGRTANLVRKAYPVSPAIVGAFAGSCFIGFELLKSVREHLSFPLGTLPNGRWAVNEKALSWAPIARAVFNQAPDAEKRLGAQFLLVGPHPAEDTLPGRAVPYLCKFSFPEFHPQIIRNGNSALSIGSGATVKKYSDGLMEALDPKSGLLQAEMNGPGHWGRTLGFLVNRLATWHPETGISDHVHIHIAYRDGFYIQNSDMTEYPPEGPREIRMPPVAESFEQLITMAQELQIDAAAATC